MEDTIRSELRILIISDEPQFSRAIRLAIGDQGYAGCVACRPADAARLTATVAPHLLVVVVGSADWESQSLAMQLREKQPSIQCLLIAHRDAALDKQLADHPLTHVVKRPFSMLQFVATVDNITRRDDVVEEAVQLAGP